MIKDYKIIKELGHGLFGTVYLVEKNGKNYALKVEHILEKDVEKNLRSPLWREIDFFSNFASKHKDQFIQLIEHDIIKNCEHKQKQNKNVPNATKNLVKSLSQSRYCSRKIYTLIDDVIAAINPNLNEIYSIIAQAVYAAYQMNKAGYVHMDLHLGNIGFVNTKDKFIKIFGKDVPTFGRKVQLIDFGFVLNRKYEMTANENNLYKIGLDKEIFSLLSIMTVDMRDLWNQIPKEMDYYYLLDQFEKTEEYELLRNIIDDKHYRFYLYQIVYNKKFQQSIFGKNHKIIPIFIFVPIDDIIYILRSSDKPKDIINYFISKIM